MKPSSPLTIYIATSAEHNLHAYSLLCMVLAERGHKIFDWRSLPEARQRKRTLDLLFTFCTEAAGSADLVIYLGSPTTDALGSVSLSGQDAVCAASMAAISGVHVFGLRTPLETPGILLTRSVTEWFRDTESLLAAVERLAEEKAKMEIVTP